jgi:RHS repeat-associated protein
VNPTDPAFLKPSDARSRSLARPSGERRDRKRFRKPASWLRPLQVSPVQTPVLRPRTCSEGPFGEVLRATGPMARANPLQFSTKYQDEETDLLYFGYRYLNVFTGRWLSRDGLQEEGGINLYVFARANPLSYCDALGFRHFCIIFYLENTVTLVTKAAEQHLDNVINALNGKLKSDDVRALFTHRGAKRDEMGLQYPSILGAGGYWTKNACPIAYGVNVEQNDEGNALTAPGGQGRHGGILLRKAGFEDNVAQKAATWEWAYDQEVSVANVMAHESIVHLILGKSHRPAKLSLDSAEHPSYIDAIQLTRQLIQNEGKILDSTIAELIKKFQLH